MHFFIPEFRSRVTALPRHAMLMMGMLVFALVIIEGIAHMTGVDGRSSLFDGQLTGGHPIEINADGIRGPMIPKEKSPETFRVLCLGDSTTFGTGVATSETWPAQIQNALSLKVDAINCGTPAASVKDLTYEIEQKWARYHPDHLVLAISNNMISLAYIHKDAPARIPSGRDAFTQARAAEPTLYSKTKRVIQSNLTSITFLKRLTSQGLYAGGVMRHHVDPDAPFGALLAHGWRQADLPDETAHEAWTAFENDLIRLGQLAENRGIPLTITYIPARFMLTSEWRDNQKWIPKWRITMDPAEHIRSICQRRNLYFVDAILELLKTRRSREEHHLDAALYIPMDYTHLDASGHAAIAKTIALGIQKMADAPSGTHHLPRAIAPAHHAPGIDDQ